MKSVAVIGLGLIGGSIARDLSARGVRVVADDRDRETLESAVGEGVAARAGETIDAEVVVIAVPVRQTVTVLADVATRAPGARLFMDTGSTKSLVVSAAAALPIADRFVGCHPLAGDHLSGFKASRHGLFEGARVFACPTVATKEESMSFAKEFWEELGAGLEFTDAARHDDLMAAASHLPQIASTSLANALRGLGLSSDVLGRGGRDMTRLAGSSPELWTDICVENSHAIAAALRSYRDSLEVLAAALERRDESALQALFSSARDWTL